VWAARWLSSVVATAVGLVTRSEQILGTVLLMDGPPTVVLALALVPHCYTVSARRRAQKASVPGPGRCLVACLMVNGRLLRIPENATSRRVVARR
jgi:hypothetical protein